jgi:hypothetical protein
VHGELVAVLALRAAVLHATKDANPKLVARGQVATCGLFLFRVGKGHGGSNAQRDENNKDAKGSHDDQGEEKRREKKRGKLGILSPKKVQERKRGYDRRHERER